MSSPTIVIVGAGFGGIAGAVELRRHGFQDITILEGAPDLGGTWFYNSYPGAACDVPSHLYSFSYEQRTSWSRLCSPQQEILGYLRRVADDHGVTPLIRFSQRVADCRFDPGSGRWTVRTESGDSHDADVLILATGQLNRPSIPGLPGLDRFAGHSFHSARWDHDYDLRGQRVAVVGTGASAVQFVPEVARQAGHLSVFQRTGNWFLPRRNHVYGPLARAAIRHVPGLQRLRRGFLFNYCESLTLAIRHPRTIGRLAGMRSAAFMRRQLPDPELRRRAWPDYTFGCKRVLFSSHYLPTLSRPNVELVTDAITEITPTGPRTQDGRVHEVDCIIWGTGFKATEFVAPTRVAGADGRTLDEVWSGGAHAHLGLTVPGFPSMFLMYGPNTNTSGGSIIFYHEAQASYIRQALEHLRAGGYHSLEVRPEVEAASDRELQARFAGTAWTGCDSWYRDRHGRIVTNWPGYMREYLERTQTFAAAEYTFSR
ncbi:MAG TPA: NAD(P)/FAD-dependent oxidoreductase [Solirubrobacteraceae bacterium]|nr:NAD(P)/FAD-dependent oxidoreductase [Solirubrobacteraceae bacterium]